MPLNQHTATETDQLDDTEERAAEESFAFLEACVGVVSLALSIVYYMVNDGEI